MERQRVSHPLGGLLQRGGECFHKTLRFSLVQPHNMMALHHFLSRSSDMRNDENRHGTSLQLCSPLQKSLVFRCHAGNETVGSALDGYGWHGVIVCQSVPHIKLCATLV